MNLFGIQTKMILSLNKNLFFRRRLKITVTYGIQLAILFLLVAGCNEKSHHQQEKGYDQFSQEVYLKSMEAWKMKRVESLKKNWISLSGLFELREGENSFGSAVSNDLVFPGTDVPEQIGTFTLSDGHVRVRIRPGINVVHNGESVHEMDMTKDIDGGPTILQIGSLSFYVIQRVDKIYIRLKDSKNPNISKFKGIEYFPTDLKWRQIARFEPHITEKIIRTTTTAGDPSEIISTGAMGFTIDGKYYRLDVWPIGQERYQTIFADGTSGNKTYGAGRFVVIEKPGDGNNYLIDFNKAYNPPCAFTEFATCPLPPPQNRLEIEILAGEKYASDEHH